MEQQIKVLQVAEQQMAVKLVAVEELGELALPMMKLAE